MNWFVNSVSIEANTAISTTSLHIYPKNNIYLQQPLRNIIKMNINQAIAIRIQRSRQHKQTVPAAYVGRGSKWGNPFRLVRTSGIWMIKTDGSERCSSILTKHARFAYATKEEAAKDAVRCYGWWLLPYEHKTGNTEEFLRSIAMMESIEELRGKNLSCWCKVGEPCHADFLLELANR